MTATDWLSAAVRAGAVDRRLQAGQALFHSGDRTRGLYEVLMGKVRLVRVDRSGREAVLQAASAGDTLAEASLFSSIYHCDAVATTEAAVRLYPKTVLFAEIARDPKLARAFAAMLAQQVMALRTKLERRNIIWRARATRYEMQLEARKEELGHVVIVVLERRGWRRRTCRSRSGAAAANEAVRGCIHAKGPAALRR